MQFTLTIDMDNAAFHEHGAPRYEVARCLRRTAVRVELVGQIEGVVLDEYGNTVGRWEITP